MNQSQRTNQLLLYIRDQRQFGKNDDEIRMALLGDGYTAEYVDRLFAHMDGGTTATAELDGTVDEPTDNGLGSFGIGVGLIVAVTLITFVVLQFTESWSLIFWGLSLLGLWGVVKGIYLGLIYPDSGQAKAGRVALYVLGLGVVGVCVFWTWTVFFDSGPPVTDAVWSESTSHPTSSGTLFRLTGTVRNNAVGWRMVDLELTVTPLNAAGDPMSDSIITFDPAPDGISPNITRSYSEYITVPRSSTGFEEQLHWQWEKD